ncbi:EG45-like domain containing protein [Syzygium oleosum]|uniref:EG45-like domain containing protein n=1 Tax=Syzygium oleosum TaxID=219896 RepID=UPI0024BBE741|nr:EG45-like domain containing protein [Syzygium oleosum]
MRRKTLKRMCHLQLLILLASVATATAAGAGVHAGTASYYGSPYLPTVCNGDDPSQLPSNGMFAAAGDELWDNGAACGREYTVRCVSLSRSIPGNCTDDDPIRVKIIDWARSSKSAAAASASKQAGEEGGAALVLSERAFKSIAKPFADSIGVEYQA